MMIGAGLAGVYTFLYITLRQQDYALLMGAIALFMLGYGAQLCLVTRFQTVAEFPSIPVGIVYLPIPVAGLITLLFLIERLWVGEPPKTSYMYSDQAVDLE